MRGFPFILRLTSQLKLAIVYNTIAQKVLKIFKKLCSKSFLNGV